MTAPAPISLNRPSIFGTMTAEKVSGRSANCPRRGRTPLGGLDVAERTCSIDGCDSPTRARGWCNRHYLRWRHTGDPTGSIPRQRPDLETRFFKRLQVVPNGCWLWQGSLDGGYGKLKVNGRPVVAHLWAYRHWVGPVPAGLQLDHFVCDTRSCVNPEHVRPVTPRENTLRGDGPAAWNAAKTHCPQGHPLEGTNLAVSGGRRACKTCRNDSGRRYRARKRLLA